MQNEDWLKIKEVFVETVNLPRDERDSFLANYSSFVQSEVRGLIKSHEEADDFIVEAAAVELGLGHDVNIGQQIDDYKIVALIGEGGMGNVYLAERIGFEQKVALKLIKRGMDSRAVLKRFKLERQILSRLNHPNIAKLLDGGETPEGLPYFVMEYIEGLPITKFCEEHQFDVHERLELFQKVCEAITYAHQNLIIHRDIKPSNIIVTNDGTPKLLDFGIAKLLYSDDSSATITQTQGRMFTPEYASPEQINGLPITTATDIYSLGVVLYELLSGVRPFNTESKNYAEIANLVLTFEPVRPSSVVFRPSLVDKKVTAENKELRTKHEEQRTKSLKGDLDNIILKAIRKEPESRYQSVSDFSADITRHLQGFPVTATTDSKLYQFEKFVKRNKLGVGVASLVMILSVFSIYQGIAATRERQRAEKSFVELRRTANELMTKTYESLQKIEGGSVVQRELVEKSIALLDTIAAENPTDTDVLEELAKGYIALGRQQQQRFRECENAVKNFKKAVELRQKILLAKPKDRQAKLELNAALGGLGETYFFFGKRDECLEIQLEQEKVVREIYAEDPNNLENKHLLAGFLYGASENYKSYQRPAEREKYLAEYAKISDETIKHHESKELSAKETSDYAYAVSAKALYLGDLGKTDEALAEHEKSSEIAAKAYQMDKNLNLAFNLTIRSQRFKADIYRQRKQFDKALEMYQISIDRFEKGSNDANVNRDGQFARSLRIYKIRKALMLQKTGKTAEAKTLMETLYQEYLAANERMKNDSTYVVYFYEVLPDIAEYFVDSNQIEKAVGVWQHHLSDIQYFLTKNPEDVAFMNYTSDAYKRIGDTYANYDEETKSFKIKDKSRLAKAKEFYLKAIESYEKAHSIYSPTQAEKDNLQELREQVRNL